MIYIHRKLGSFGPHWNRDGAQNQSSRGAASRRAFYATRLVTTSSSALPRNVPPTTSIPQACPYCRMLGGSKPSPSGEGFSVLNRGVTGPLWEFLSLILLEWEELCPMEV